jgi:hypothetical protein
MEQMPLMLIVAFPPTGISAVPAVEPVPTVKVLACRFHGAVEVALVLTVAVPMLDVQGVNLMSVIKNCVCVVGT